jgi:hypothetical protein
MDLLEGVPRDQVYYALPRLDNTSAHTLGYRLDRGTVHFSIHSVRFASANFGDMYSVLFSLPPELETPVKMLNPWIRTQFLQILQIFLSGAKAQCRFHLDLPCIVSKLYEDISTILREEELKPPCEPLYESLGDKVNDLYD